MENDLISRQAAIDAMCELMRHWFGGDPKDEIREIKRELEKLPSAQPNTKEHSQHVESVGDTISRHAAITNRPDGGAKFFLDGYKIAAEKWNRRGE